MISRVFNSFLSANTSGSFSISRVKLSLLVSTLTRFNVVLRLPLLGSLSSIRSSAVVFLFASESESSTSCNESLFLSFGFWLSSTSVSVVDDESFLKSSSAELSSMINPRSNLWASLSFLVVVFSSRLITTAAVWFSSSSLSDRVGSDFISKFTLYSKLFGTIGSVRSSVSPIFFSF